MGIKVQWDDAAKRMVRFDFDEQWTWEEFFVAKKESYMLIDSVSRKVAVIMVAPPKMTLPPNMLTHGLNALRSKHANNHVVIFVLTDSFLRTMLTTMAKVSRLAQSSTSVVSSLNEARALATKRLSLVYDDDDATIPER